MTRTTANHNPTGKPEHQPPARPMIAEAMMIWMRSRIPLPQARPIRHPAPHLTFHPAIGRAVLVTIASMALATGTFTATLAAQAPPAAAQPPSTQQDAAAQAALASAKTAYEQRNLPAAIDQFRNFLKTHPSRPEASTASYYLGLCLLEGPQPDLAAAAEALDAPGQNAGFPDRGQALLHRGLALSAQAQRLAAQALTDTANASQHRTKSVELSTQAAAALAAAAEALKASPADALRARALQADALLGADKPADALTLLTPILKDPATPQSPAGRAAALTAGQAALAQKDIASTVRSLSLLAPFDDLTFATTAHLSLAQAHHTAGDRPEAAAHYTQAIASAAKARSFAEESLRNPAPFRNRLDERFRLESTLAQLPSFIASATYHSGILAQETLRHADAATHFTTFIQQNLKSPLIADAGLRLGICRVELKQFPDAIKILTPLADHPSLADHATWHLARAKVGAADPANRAAYQQQIAEAVTLFRKAAEKAAALSATDPTAKARRGEIFMDLASAHQQAGQFTEAATTLRALLDEAQWPDLAETALHRLVANTHFAGQYEASNQHAQQFQTIYPQSPNLASVLFYSAENASVPAASAKPDAAPALYDAAIQRYQLVISRYPEFPQVNHARFGLASAHYHLGRYAEAAAAFTTIPAADRSGPLITTPYLLADCLVRTLPERADDALTAGRFIDQAETASKLLGEFLASNATHPQAPEALLKLGQTRLRLAAILAEPTARQQTIQTARQALETIVQKHAKHATFPTAVFELARATQELGDHNGAANQFNRFRSELKDAPIAPLAIAHLGDCLCKLNRAPEAVDILTQVRSAQEAILAEDPARAAYIPRLKLAHALALKHVGKFAEATPLLTDVIASDPTDAAEAQWRLAQVRKDEASAGLAAAQKKLSEVKPEEREAAKAALAQALTSLTDAATGLVKQADAFTDTHPSLRLQTLGDAASAFAALREIQLADTRAAAATASINKLLARRTAEVPTLPNLPPLRDPQTPIAALPVPPAEASLRSTLSAIIESAPDSHEAVQAALQLAQLHAQRNEHDAAIALLRDAASQAPADPSLAEMLKVELGYAHLAKGEAEPAARLFEAVMQNVRSPHYPRARLGFALQYIVQKNWTTAAERLVRFRDKPVLQNLPGVTDLALLRLGQALAHTGAHEESRAALQMIVDRFGGSPHRNEARFGIAEALRNLKRHDEAIAMYQQVIQRTGNDLGARSHLGVGLVQIEQKKYNEALATLTVIPYTYDHPEISATALWESHNALVHLQKKSDATALLQRIVKEHPTGRWAEMAQKRLTELK